MSLNIAVTNILNSINWNKNFGYFDFVKSLFKINKAFVCFIWNLNFSIYYKAKYMKELSKFDNKINFDDSDSEEDTLIQESKFDKELVSYYYNKLNQRMNNIDRIFDSITTPN